MTEKAYANFIPEIWGQKINYAIEKNCVMLQCVNRDWQADADKGGDVINIITPSEVSASMYTGAISAYETPESVKAQLRLDQETYFAFSVPDISEVQSNVSIFDSYVEKAKMALELKLDSYLFGKSADTAAANILGADAAVELTSENIYSKFVEMAKMLKVSGAMGMDASLGGSDYGLEGAGYSGNGAGIGEGGAGIGEAGGSSGVIKSRKAPWVVVHPDVEELLLNSSQFATASVLGDKLKREGAIGKVAGLEVLVSNNVGKVMDSGSAKYTVFAGTNEGITFASQIKKIESIRDKGSFADLVRGLYVYGALAVNPKCLALMKATI